MTAVMTLSIVWTALFVMGLAAFRTHGRLHRSGFDLDQIADETEGEYEATNDRSSTHSQQTQLRSLQGLDTTTGIPLSEAIYRIPYIDGTSVQISFDHVDHAPPGAVDMFGIGGTLGAYRIVAAADGFVRYITDIYDTRLDCSIPGIRKENNFIWIQHDNGEWTKYSHLAMNSITGDAGLVVGQFVTAGTFLGFEDDVGCASGPHLHFEVGVPNLEAPVPITEVGGFLNFNEYGQRYRIPRINDITQNLFRTDHSYTAGYTRVEDQRVFHTIRGSKVSALVNAQSPDFVVEWVDAFSTNNIGEVFFNLIFRKRFGVRTVFFFDIEANDYPALLDTWFSQGFRLHHIDTYSKNMMNIYYTAIFRSDDGPPFRTYQGVSGQESSRLFNQFRDEGLRPKILTAVAVNGSLRYTGFYDGSNFGLWFARSFLTLEQYLEEKASNQAAGRHLIFLNGYIHRNVLHFSAIWSSATGEAASLDKDSMSKKKLKSRLSKMRRKGYLLRVVTGYMRNGKKRYSAYWRK